MAYDKAKFAGLDKALDDAKRSGIGVIIVTSPQVLGDDYEELVVNLDKIAAKELALQIVPPTRRKDAKLN